MNLVSFILVLSSYTLYCQTDFSSYIINIPNDVSLKEELNKIIKKDYYIDPNDDYFKIAFSLKVDSLGEVHSAHIRWSRNLKQTKYYTICYEIESHFNLLYIYDRFKKDFIGMKYVLCTFPYSTKK